MKYISTPTTQNMFDGPFKVPLPKKTSAFSPQKQSPRSSLKAPQPKYKGVDAKYSSFVYQKLLGKLLQTPDQMTKYDMKVLSTHPVIRRLLKSSKEGSLANTHFYVPIDSLLQPELYADSHVPVIIESQSGEPKSEVANQNDSQNFDEDISDETTNSNTDSEESQEQRIGFYTQKERQERIAKYKQKLQRYRAGKATQKPKPKRKYNRLLSQSQPRKNGRFASYPDVTDSILEEIQNGTENTPSTCSSQYMTGEVIGEEKNLNDLVSEITGIF